MLYLVCGKIHSVVHAATEIMRWGNLINCSGEAAEKTHKINVKGPGANINHRESDGYTLLNHARRKATVQALGAAIQGNARPVCTVHENHDDNLKPSHTSLMIQVLFWGFIDFLLCSARIDDNDPEFWMSIGLTNPVDPMPG